MSGDLACGFCGSDRYGIDQGGRNGVLDTRVARGRKHRDYYDDDADV